MNMMSRIEKFATREAWLQEFIEMARVKFDEIGFTLPERIRVSIGFTSGGTRGKSIGECWTDKASVDEHFEIFLRPTVIGASRYADILTHELVHAAVGLAAKHGKEFGKCARALGLQGKLTATVAGAGWHAWADPIVKALGPLPHGELRDMVAPKPKQPTALLKAECDTCGCVFRITKKWVEGKTLRCVDSACDGDVHVYGGDND